MYAINCSIETVMTGDFSRCLGDEWFKNQLTEQVISDKMVETDNLCVELTSPTHKMSRKISRREKLILVDTFIPQCYRCGPWQESRVCAGETHEPILGRVVSVWTNFLEMILWLSQWFLLLCIPLGQSKGVQWLPLSGHQDLLLCPE